MSLRDVVGLKGSYYLLVLFESIPFRPCADLECSSAKLVLLDLGALERLYKNAHAISIDRIYKTTWAVNPIQLVNQWYIRTG